MLIGCISDFGSAKFLDDSGIDLAYTTVMASMAWCPPEYLFDERPHYSNPTTHGDIWSLGCTLLEVRDVLVYDICWDSAPIQRH